MEHFAILGAKRVFMESALYAGSIALLISEMMEHFVLNLLLMVEALATLYGVKINANGIIPTLVVKNGV